MKTVELFRHYDHERNWNIEVCFPYSPLALEYSEHYGRKTFYIALLGFALFISKECWMDYDRDVAWGFSFTMNRDPQALFLYWGKRCKIFYYPWADWGSCIRHEVMLEDGTFVKAPEYWTNLETGRYEKQPDPENLYKKTVPYTYVLKNGTVQNRMATVTVGEMEWRLRLLRWTKMFNKVSRTIWVDFDDEVGERTGSWKGGVVGCGYELLPGEDPIDCLRRMEKEQEFNQ